MNRKHILLYGDSNTWGYNAETQGRFSDDERWGNLLAEMLGDEYDVAQNGLNGRTTVFDDPLTEDLSGLAHIRVALACHAPLEIVVIMLGTNDCKQRFNATPENIVRGVENVVQKARSYDYLCGEKRIIIVAPINIDDRICNTEMFGMMGEGCAEKSQKLPELLEAKAKELGCEYLNANDFVTPITADYMHFDLKSQQPFATALYKKIKGV